MAAKDIVTRLLITAKDEASGVFSSLQRHAGKIAAGIAAYFSVRFFTGSIQSAAEFETQMSTVGAVTRATAEDMALLRKAADEAGTNTRFTATQAAEALENLARAGLDARESVEALPAVLALAQANGVGLAESSSLVTRAVRGMGLEVSEAGRVADVLTEAAARANTNVEGLGQALAYAAPTAQALGLSLEDTVAIIGKFADAGIDASRAGTALNSIMAQFSNPASKFRQELGAAGITTTDFDKALRQLADAGPRGQKAIIAVGQEAGPALRALLNQGIASLDDLRAALGNAEGAAAKAAATMDNNLDGAMLGLSSAWDALRRGLASPVLEPIQQAVSNLAERMRAFVSSGVVGQIGDTIATAFRSAGDAFFAFLDGFEVEAVIAKLQSWASTTRETVEQWGGYLATASTIALTSFATIGTGLDALKTMFFAVASVAATAFDHIADRVANLADGFAKITSGEVSERFRRVTDEARRYAESFGTAAEQNAEKARAALERTAESAQGLRDRFTEMTGAQTANTSAMAQVQVQAVLTAEQLDELGDGYEFVDGTARKAAPAITATADAAAKAAQKQKDAAEAANELALAYKRLGIQSQAALKEAAEEARKDFEKIRNSGRATFADLQNAFRAYAEKAIAANNGVADAALKAHASFYRLKIEADGAGQSVVRSMDEAAASVDRLGEKAASTTREIARIGDEAVRAAEKIEGAASWTAPGGADLLGPARGSKFDREAEEAAKKAFDAALAQGQNADVALAKARRAAAALIQRMKEEERRRQRDDGKSIGGGGRGGSISTGPGGGLIDTDPERDAPEPPDNFTRPPGPRQEPGNQPGPAVRHELVLRFGARSTTIGVSSAADVEAFKTFMTVLEDSARRAS